jgi:hypothetical protein
VLCREVKEPDHVCDKNAVENVNAINTECKSCPQCATMIYRTQGCNHMKCTACHSHFDWESGRLLKASTNHHYDNVARFSINIAQRGIEMVQSDGICEDDRGIDLLNNHIPRDVFQGLFDELFINESFKQNIELNEVIRVLISVLYDDPDVIRTTKTSKFTERNIIAHTNNSLINDRVKFLMDETTEARWKSRIYTLEKQKDASLHIAEVMNIYLTTVRDFQSYTRNTLMNALGTTDTPHTPHTTQTPPKLPNINNIIEKLTQVKTEYLQFIHMINESFASLHEEYGGLQITIRDDFSNPHLPAIVM